MPQMKRKKNSVYIIIWLLQLQWLPALFFLNSCYSNKQSDDQDFGDVRVKKIHAFINDSASYFRAIDSVFADLSPFKRAYETYNTKRGYFYTQKRNYEKALQYSDSSLLLLNEHKNAPEYKLWYAQALSLKADDLHALKRYSEAFTYYFLAREAVYQSGDTCLFADYSTKLGMVSYQHKQYKEAVSYFKQAAAQRMACPNEKNINNASLQFAYHQNILDNIGICFSRLGMPDSAIYYFDSALHYIDLNHHKSFKYDKNNNRQNDTDFVQSAKGVIYGNMATDYQAKNNDSLAEQLLKTSVAINSKPQRAIEDVPYSLAKLAVIYLSHSRLKDAENTLTNLKHLLDTIPNAEVLQKWFNLQAKLSTQKQDYKAAGEYMSGYIAIKDSLNTIESERLGIDIQQTFSYLKTQNDLYIFKKDDEKKRSYLQLLGIILLTLSAISLLIWKNSRQAKKHLKALGELNAQLQKKHRHLERTFEALQSSHDDNTRLLTIVAHDLRNPVSGIAGMSDFLLKEDSYTDMQRKMLGMIRESSYHSLELIQELVNVNSRITDFKKEPLDLSLLINYCVEMLQIEANKKSQHIKANIAAVKVTGEREKLWRVFANLLGNAIKFSARSSDIEVSVTVKDKDAIIAIKDHGIGIPEDIKEKIFKMDPDIKRKGTAGESSFGLGLAICRQIITNHNGTIWFVSEENKGTVFYVSLPATA